MAMRISLNHDVRCDLGFLCERLGFPNRKRFLRFRGFLWFRFGISKSRFTIQKRGQG